MAETLESEVNRLLNGRTSSSPSEGLPDDGTAEYGLDDKTEQGRCTSPDIVAFDILVIRDRDGRWRARLDTCDGPTWFIGDTPGVAMLFAADSIRERTL